MNPYFNNCDLSIGDEQYQLADAINELWSQDLDVFDGPSCSVYDERVTMLGYPVSQESHLGTTAQEAFEPYLQHSQLRNGIENRTYQPRYGHDQQSQSPADHSLPLTPNASLGTNANGMDLSILQNYNNGADGQQLANGSEQSPSSSRLSATRHRPRRQNHACDMCRSSKKACDLPLTVSIGEKYKTSKGCTTCKIRGVDCTARWLFDKKLVKQTKKKAAKPEQSLFDSRLIDNIDTTSSMHEPFGIPTPTSTAELELGRHFMAQMKCSESFYLYVHTCDRPLTQCLLGGSMPPRYSLGIGAYIPLCNSPQASAYTQLAGSWIETCWPLSPANHADPTLMGVAPYLFSGMSVLDALLFRPQGAQSKSQSSTSSRDMRITEAYKWVAIANATQFALKKTENQSSQSFQSDSSRDAKMTSLQDIAYAAWCKARDMLFRNIAATNSFRLSTALMLFGMIRPAGNSAIDRQACQEDSHYALQEGLKRLTLLNEQVRSQLRRCEEAERERFQSSKPTSECRPDDLVGKLSAADRTNLLELIAASEWMVSLTNSVVIGTSKGSICPLPLDHDFATISEQSEKRCRQLGNAPASPSSWPGESHIDELILERTKDNTKSAVACQELGDDDSMIRVARKANSITIVLWQSLARFTMAAKALDYSAISQWYTITTTLVGLWRNQFGSLRASTKLRFHKPSYRRMFAISSDDADAAILLFFEQVKRLETHLSMQPLSSCPEKEQLVNTLGAASTYRQKQRLTSAIMVSVMAASFDNATTEADPQSLGEDHYGMSVHPVSERICVFFFFFFCFVSRHPPTHTF